MNKRLNYILKELTETIERRSGRTTRMIDAAIQELFTTGVTVGYDHHYDREGRNKESSKYMFDRMLRRIQSEHPGTYADLVINHRHKVIAIKSFPMALQKFDKIIYEILRSEK